MVRHRPATALRRGGPVSPPLFASTNLFATGGLVLLGSGASALHLLWWLPLSAVLGIPWLVFPFWVGLDIAGSSLLAGLVNHRIIVRAMSSLPSTWHCPGTTIS